MKRLRNIGYLVASALLVFLMVLSGETHFEEYE